ncbi:MAG: hypothetical protein JWO63_1617 [Frankiales bacterium]|nr:hypothetical protein [Frankiales bacterium]
MSPAESPGPPAPILPESAGGLGIKGRPWRN